MASNNNIFNIGIGIDGQSVQTDLTELFNEIKKRLDANGVEIPFEIKNQADVEKMYKLITDMGGSFTVLKNTADGSLKAVSVRIENVTGDLVKMNAEIQNTIQSAGNIKTVTPTIATDRRSGKEKSSVTVSSSSDETKQFEQIKSYYEKIESLMNSRIELQTKLQAATEQGNLSEISSVQKTIAKNEELIKVNQKSADILEQVYNASGTNEYSEKIDELKTRTQALNKETETLSGSLKTTFQYATNSNGFGLTKEFQDLASQINEIKKAFEDYYNLKKKLTATSKTDDGTSAEYAELSKQLEQAKTKLLELNNTSSSYSKVGMEVREVNGQLVADFKDEASAVTQNSTELKNLVTETSNLADAQTRYEAAKSDKEEDTEKINRTVEAYRSYREELDKLYEMRLSGDYSNNEIEDEQKVVDKLKDSYEQLEKQETSYGIAVGETTEYLRSKNQVTRDSIQAQNRLKEAMEDNALKRAITDIAEYIVSLEALKDAMKKIIDTTFELNESMTGIQIVTESTNKEAKELMNTYSEIGKELGASTTDIAAAAEEWLRQGNSIEETNELLKASTVLQTTGAMSAEDSVTSLTAAINGYGLATSEAMNLVDKFTTLDLDLAVSSEGVATSLSRVASAANQAGVDLNKMTSILAVTIDQTQGSAETVGRAWNSILQRMNKISAGKDIEDTGESFNDVEKALKNVGIALKDTEGQFRSSGEVLDEIAAKWETLTKNEKSQVATAVAGTNQANQFRAAMADWNEVLTESEKIENVSGSAMERMATYSESLAGKIASLQATWEQFVNDLNLDGTISVVLDIAQAALELLNLLLNKIPVLSTLIKTALIAQTLNLLAGTVSGISKKFSAFFQTISSGAISVSEVYGSFISVLNGASTSITKQASLSANLGTVLGNLARTAGITTASFTTLLGVLGGIAVALGVAYAAYTYWKDNVSLDGQIENLQTELDESNSKLETTKAKLTEIKDEIASIQENGVDGTEKERLNTLKDELEYYEAINKTEEEHTNSIKEQLALKNKEKLDDKYNDDWTNLFGQSNANRIIEEYEDTAKRIQALKKEVVDGYDIDDDLIPDLEDDLNGLYSKLLEQKEELLEDKKAYEDMGETGSDAYKKIVSYLDKIDMLLDPEEFFDEKWADVSELVDIDAFVQKFKEAGDEAGKIYTQKVQEIANTIRNSTELSDAFSEMLNVDVGTAEGYTELIELIGTKLKEALKESTAAAEEAQYSYVSGANALSLYSTAVSEVESEISDLQTAFNEMHESGELSNDTLQKLIASHPELADAIEIVNGKITVNIEALEDARKAEYDYQIAVTESQIQATKDTITEVEKRIKIYEAEFGVLSGISRQFSTMAQQSASAKWGDQTIKLPGMTDGISASEAYINGLKKQSEEATESLKNLQTVLEGLKSDRDSGFDYTGSSNKSSKTQKTAEEQALEARKEQYENDKAVLELQKEQMELEKSEAEAVKSKLELEKSEYELKKKTLEAEKDLLEQELEEVENAEDAIDNLMDMLKEMNSQGWKLVKDVLSSASDALDEQRDALEDQKDEYEGVIDAAKERLEAEKEALQAQEKQIENQKKLQEKENSVSDIQAQLNEIAYDDSADAAAKRLELQKELIEAQEDLKDEIQSQAYDTKEDAIDAQIDALDNAKDANEEALDEIDKGLEETQNKISQLSDFISNVLQSDAALYLQSQLELNAAAKSGGDELLTALKSWDSVYGDHLESTVTSAWNDALTALNKYKDAASGEIEVGTIRNNLGNQDYTLNAQITDYDQQITGIDNTIAQYELSIDKQTQKIDSLSLSIDNVTRQLDALEIEYDEDCLKIKGLSSSVEQNKASQDANTTSTDANTTSTDSNTTSTDTNTTETDNNTEATQNETEAEELEAKQAKKTTEAQKDLASFTEEVTGEVENMGDKSDEASGKIEGLGNSAEGAAGEIADAAAKGGTTLKNGLIDLASNFLKTGNLDVSGFISNVNWSSAFASGFTSLGEWMADSIANALVPTDHAGTDEVTKQDNILDQMLGLGPDETTRVLEVGEAVVPDYLNNPSLKQLDEPFSAGTALNTSAGTALNTSAGTALKIDMGDINIEGLDLDGLQSELSSIKEEAKNAVCELLNKHIKMAGYRNVNGKR